ncbi:syntabulin isoform X1 [Pantherophis guttatus]|uniref:Syntabulin isoform X1 n=1 Tax=Pantherophis guttatus TaxID=94885 RepID=A0A6P9C3X1_PANGU|nr:syntabulin isoform X1 [Pantherophis guttatus]
MGPLKESCKKDHKMQDKEFCRSRIPRLVLRPHLPQQHFQYQKVSPASESPFSEEESKEFNPLSSSGRSARTISSNSFCSDDTGCPSSQSVSPVKTPPDTGNSPITFCTGSDGGDYARKKFNSGTVADGTHQPARYKKEAKTNLIKPGSEADFSSSSSTGSISAPEVHMSAGSGNKRSSFSRNRGPHGRNHGSLPYKSGSSPPTTVREKDFLSMLCKNQLSPVSPHQNYGASSASSSNSGSYKGNDNSPTFRRPVRYNSCGENHGIKPPSPEQYLTPLQQKEVTVRHLKTKLKESESRLQERESEIKELKSQLARMRDDWIEEECHRVEAQLALKEARKEIKQLKQVIETMKNSLAEKDKGIQKYFVDINIQNKKLESLLQSMELAQNGSSREDQSLEYECDLSPDKSFSMSTTYSKTEDSMFTENHSVEADSGVLLSDDVANGNDIFEETMFATTPEFGHPALFTSSTFNHLDLVQSLGNSQVEDDNHSEAMEQAVQADVLLYRSGMEQLIENIFKAQDVCPINPSPVLVESSVSHPENISDLLVDLTPTDPNSAILLSPLEPMPRPVDSRYYKNRVMKELDFIDYHTTTLANVTKMSEGNIVKRYWSSNFLIDLLAIGAPIVPTIMWMFSTRRGGTIPIFTFGALFRGCCLLALNSLRQEPVILQR